MPSIDTEDSPGFPSMDVTDVENPSFDSRTDVADVSNRRVVFLPEEKGR